MRVESAYTDRFIEAAELLGVDDAASMRDDIHRMIFGIGPLTSLENDPEDVVLAEFSKARLRVPTWATGRGVVDAAAALAMAPRAGEGHITLPHERRLRAGAVLDTGRQEYWTCPWDDLPSTYKEIER